MTLIRGRIKVVSITALHSP